MAIKLGGLALASVLSSACSSGRPRRCRRRMEWRPSASKVGNGTEQVRWAGGGWRGMAGLARHGWRGVGWRGMGWRGAGWRGVAWRGGWGYNRLGWGRGLYAYGGPSWGYRRPLYAYAGPGFNRWGWRRPLYAAAAVATRSRLCFRCLGFRLVRRRRLGRRRSVLRLWWLWRTRLECRLEWRLEWRLERRLGLASELVVTHLPRSPSL